MPRQGIESLLEYIDDGLRRLLRDFVRCGYYTPGKIPPSFEEFRHLLMEDKKVIEIVVRIEVEDLYAALDHERPVGVTAAVDPRDAA